MQLPILTWQDTRGTWYAKELQPFDKPEGPKVGPYGTEQEALCALDIRLMTREEN